MRRRHIHALSAALLALLLAIPFVASGDEGREDGARPGTPVSESETAADTPGDPNGSDADGPGGRSDSTSDVEIDASLCVGNDCVINGESYGFHTIRLKENNLRITAMDTSGSSFPDRDWQIEFNSRSSGGAEYFMVRDCGNTASTSATCGGTPQLTIEAGADNHSIYVDSSGNQGGNVGLGTSAPVVDLHILSGNTPTLRLDQDGSSGFTAQRWDVAGNESNFFIRDVTNGSALPFRIEPGTASNTLYLDNKEFVGFNNTSPTHQIHAKGTSSLNNEANETAIKVENTSATSARRYLLQLENFGHTGMRLYDSDRAAGWIIVNQATDLRFRADASTSWPFILDADGNLTIAGDLTADGTLYASDASRKSGFTAVDPASVLAGVRSLTIGTWTWVDGDGTLHMGPTAQEFAAAFGLGGTDTAIDAADVNGVTLAAIQALAAENEALSAQNAALEERLAALEALVAALLADG